MHFPATNTDVSPGCCKTDSQKPNMWFYLIRDWTFYALGCVYNVCLGESVLWELCLSSGESILHSRWVCHHLEMALLADSGAVWESIKQMNKNNSTVTTWSNTVPLLQSMPATHTNTRPPGGRSEVEHCCNSGSIEPFRLQLLKILHHYS